MAGAGPENVMVHTAFETGPGYLYLLPFHPIDDSTKDVLGVSLSSLNPFIELYSDTQLSEAEAYIQVSKSLSISALFMTRGVIDRNSGAIGGFCEMRSSHKNYGDVSDLPDLARAFYDELDYEADSFQIQSRFTLSRAYALSSDFESSCIEFFKIVELYVKHLAYTSQLSDGATRQVTSGSVFGCAVRKDIVDKGFISSELLYLLDNIRGVRNFFIGHGGVRSVVSRLFGDTEAGHRVEVFKKAQNKVGLLDGHGLEGHFYDLKLDDYEDSPLFLRIGADFSLLSRFIFCKLQGVTPVLVYQPMCWFEASREVISILERDGATFIGERLR